MYNQICANGDELFELERGERWTCQFSRARYREFQTLILGDHWEPPEAYQCEHGMASGG